VELDFEAIFSGYALYFIIPCFIISTTLYFIRLIRGPTIPDMVLATSCISYNACFFMCILSIYFKNPYLVLAAFCLALWVFILDLYVAKYLEGRELGE